MLRFPICTRLNYNNEHTNRLDDAFKSTSFHTETDHRFTDFSSNLNVGRYCGSYKIVTIRQRLYLCCLLNLQVSYNH